MEAVQCTRRSRYEYRSKRPLGRTCDSSLMGVVLDVLETYPLPAPPLARIAGSGPPVRADLRRWRGCPAISGDASKACRSTESWDSLADRRKFPDWWRRGEHR